MEKEKKCTACGREFVNEEALSQHIKSKHMQDADRNPAKKPYRAKGKIILVIIGIAIIISIYWAISSYIAESNYCKKTPAKEINIGSHANLALHIHADLKIMIDGKELPIPANIRIMPGVMRPIHTHDSSGEIHIEGPCERKFRLGEFFNIWGRGFSRECIFDYCIENGTLKVKINGAEDNNFENYIIREKDNILIEYLSSK